MCVYILGFGGNNREKTLQTLKGSSQNVVQVFMTHRREKNGHIAPLQKCLIKDILSLFDKEQVQGGF